jgi:hypothetical protein
VAPIAAPFFTVKETQDVFGQQLSQVYLIPLNTPNSSVEDDTLVHIKALQALMPNAQAYWPPTARIRQLSDSSIFMCSYHYIKAAFQVVSRNTRLENREYCSRDAA